MGITRPLGCDHSNVRSRLRDATTNDKINSYLLRIGAHTGQFLFSIRKQSYWIYLSKPSWGVLGGVMIDKDFHCYTLTVLSAHPPLSFGFSARGSYTQIQRLLMLLYEMFRPFLRYGFVSSRNVYWSATWWWIAKEWVTARHFNAYNDAQNTFLATVSITWQCLHRHASTLGIWTVDGRGY